MEISWLNLRFSDRLNSAVRRDCSDICKSSSRSVSRTTSTGNAKAPALDFAPAFTNNYRIDLLWSGHVPAHSISSGPVQQWENGQIFGCRRQFLRPFFYDVFWVLYKKKPTFKFLFNFISTFETIHKNTLFYK